ncbi:MAG: hypothetical protein ACK46Y_17280 [Fluviicola sp.]
MIKKTKKLEYYSPTFLFLNFQSNRDINDLGVELISEIDGFIKDKDNNSTELVSLKVKLEKYQKKINDLELNKK